MVDFHKLSNFIFIVGFVRYDTPSGTSQFSTEASVYTSVYCVIDMQRLTEDVLLIKQGLNITCNCTPVVTIIGHIEKILTSPQSLRLNLFKVLTRTWSCYV